MARFLSLPLPVDRPADGATLHWNRIGEIGGIAFSNSGDTAFPLAAPEASLQVKHDGLASSGSTTLTIGGRRIRPSL